MNYDKNSFLAGLSVGRTLKGWASIREKIAPLSTIVIFPVVSVQVPPIPVTINTVTPVSQLEVDIGPYISVQVPPEPILVSGIEEA